MGGDSNGQVMEIGVKNSEKEETFDGHVYTEILDWGYGRREDECASDRTWRLKEDFVAPSRSAIGLMLGGKIMQPLDVTMTASSPSNDAPVRGLGRPSSVEHVEGKGGMVAAMIYW